MESYQIVFNIPEIVFSVYKKCFNLLNYHKLKELKEIRLEIKLVDTLSKIKISHTLSG